MTLKENITIYLGKNLNKLIIKYKFYPKSTTIDALKKKYANVTALIITT